MKLSKKDYELIKSALRRAFSRSERRRDVVARSIIKHEDSSRPKVKSWGKCEACGKPEARSYLQADHIEPYVPLGKSFSDLTPDEMIYRLWCDESNLQVLDKACHKAKSSLERKARAKKRKEKK